MFKLSAFLVAIVLFKTVSADKVKATVYMEALCPDSKDFVTNQLFPLYSDQEFKDRLDVELVPFGKASFKETNGELKFTCQHGPKECMANTYLSCSLKLYSPDQALKYTNCIMSENMPAEHLESCAKKLSLNYTDLKSCEEDKTKGPLYLKEQGQKTFSLKPKLIFVPTVVLNDKYERKEMPEILSNFKKVVCSKLQDKPKSC